MRVYDGAQPQRFGFAAGRVELLLRHGDGATFANALRGEDLDQVGALLFAVPDQLAQLGGVAASFGQRLERRQNARSGQDSARRRVPQVLVHQRPGALHSGETGVQRPHQVVGDVQDRLRLRLLAPGIAVLVVEMIGQMRVRVDPAGRYRQRAQIVSDGVGRGRAAHARDFRAFHYYDGVAQHLALAVQQRGRLEDDGALLGKHRGRAKDQNQNF